MHGNIGDTVRQGVLDSLCKHAEPAHGGEGRCLIPVSVSFDDHQLRRHRCKQRLNMLGLPECQRTSTRADAKGHKEMV